jgi:hypothetical protein
MNGKLKALGLAFLAVFAFGAIAAQAQAAEFFHSEEKNTILTGTAEGNQIFKPVTGGTVEVICGHADFAGTVAATGGGTGNWTSETVTVHPRYYGEAGKPEQECLTAANLTKVHTNKCHYTLNANTTTGNPTGGSHAKVELSECELGGIVLTETVNGLTVTVPNQTIADAVRYTNTTEVKEKPSTRSVTLTATAHSIEWKCTPKAACLAAFGASSGTEATYAGNTTVKGYADPEVQTTPENNVYAKEGAQIGIWKE